MANARITTVDEYLGGVGPDQRAALERLRGLIRKAAPHSTECIRYGIVAFRTKKTLVGIGASSGHCAFYLMSGTALEAHADDVAKYDTSKGTIRFSPEKPLPATLVRKLVKTRLRENGEIGER